MSLSNLRPKYQDSLEAEDELRMKAIRNIAKNITDSEHLFEALQMLGLVDEKGDYVPALNLHASTALVGKHKDVVSWRRD